MKIVRLFNSLKKRLFLLAIAIISFAFSLNGQNFLDLTKSSSGQTIILNINQVLEIKLPATPSTGYNWYVTLINKGVITPIGNEEFISDPNSGMVGQSGTKVIRFAGVSQGTSVLTLEYKRIWEKDKASLDNFKITVVSSGKYTGNYVPSVKSKSVKKHTSSSTPKSIPSSFSWQSECSPVKNQGSCGSCWAFAGCGTFEASINIWDHVIKNISEQWLINCATDMLGCSGGWSPVHYFQSPGTVYEADEPYQQAEGTCQPSYTYHEQIIDYGSASTDAQIKQAIYDYGPVWSCVYAGGSGFSNYYGGIFLADDGGSQVDHAIVLVGWKDTLLSNGSSGYWILRNSWGPYWGENGYIRIAYGVNLVGYSTSYINYKGILPHNGSLAADFSGSPYSGDAPLNVQFVDNSFTPSGTTISFWSWNFGDGSTSTLQTPSHTYTAPGTYSVTLTVTNSASATNSLTKTNYITVYPLGSTFNMTTTTTTTCSGNFFDPGGSGASYLDNQDYTMTFLPDVIGNKIQMTFNSFNLEPDVSCVYDYLKIYDGINANAPLLGTYCGTTSPGIVSATNAAGALTFVFHSDEGVTATGWAATIHCTSSSPVLTVITTVASSVTASSAITGGNVTNDGGLSVTARGVCWGTIVNPSISGTHTTDGTGTGIFSSNLTGLTVGTTYHIRAYATNSAGTAYGNDLTFTTTSAPGNSVWIEQVSGFVTASRGISGFSIVDANNAWAWAFDGTGNGTACQDFTKTNNGGTLWTAKTIAGNTALSIGNISAINGTIAFASMYDPTNGGGKVMKTTDGGTSWVQQTTAAFGISSWLNFIHFFDANNGIAMGDPTNGKFEIYTTINGGTTWTLNTNIGLTAASIYGYTNDFCALGNTIWFGTNSSMIYKSTDKGITWTSYSTGLTEVPKVSFFDQNNGFAFYKNTSTFSVKKSIDGGATWNTYAVPTNLHQADISSVPGLSNTLVSVGANANIGDLGSSYTKDSGIAFDTIDSGVQYTAVSFFDQNTGYAGGFNQSATIGGIYKWIGAPMVSCAATPSTINTGSSAQLQTTATGGFGNYIYSWTSSPAGFTNNVSNPTVSPIVPTTYMSSVQSAFNVSTATCLLNVNPLGITQNPDKTNVLIFPNPTTGIINIMNAENAVICIYNSIGMVVYKKTTTEKVTSVDLSYLSSGSYLIQVISKGHSIMKKISLSK